MRFWDTSAVLPLFVNQPHTSSAKEAFAADTETVIWWAARVEYESALQRLRRDAVLDDDGTATARESFATFREGAVEVQPSDEVRATAIELLGKHPLRAADALQLAAALIWSGGTPGSGFVSFDHRLSEAAADEGFVVLPGPGSADDQES